MTRYVLRGCIALMLLSMAAFSALGAEIQLQLPEAQGSGTLHQVEFVFTPQEGEEYSLLGGDIMFSPEEITSLAEDLAKGEALANTPWDLQVAQFDVRGNKRVLRFLLANTSGAALPRGEVLSLTLREGEDYRSGEGIVLHISATDPQAREFAVQGTVTAGTGESPAPDTGASSGTGGSLGCALGAASPLALLLVLPLLLFRR